MGREPHTDEELRTSCDSRDLTRCIFKRRYTKDRCRIPKAGSDKNRVSTTGFREGVALPMPAP